MNRNLDIDLLRTLVAIADAGSFTAAAERVGRTQSAVSMQMRRLEEQIERPLFERDGRTVTFTAAGQDLLVYARRILRLQDAALSSLRQPEMEGVARVGIPDDYVGVFMPPILARFARSHPRVQADLRCDTSDRLRDTLMAGEIDLAVVTCGALTEESQPLKKESVVWAAPRDHRVEDEPVLPLALFAAPCQVREATVSALDAMDRLHRVAYVSPSLMGLFAAVNAGLAMTTIGRSALLPGMRILGPAEGFPTLPDIVLTLERTPRERSAAVEALADHIVESFRGELHDPRIQPKDVPERWRRAGE
jgi:DNA-binding transcriptional LysR family regulator